MKCNNDGSAIAFIFILLTILTIALSNIIQNISYRHQASILFEKQIRKKWIAEGLIQYAIAWVKNNQSNIDIKAEKTITLPLDNWLPNQMQKQQGIISITQLNNSYHISGAIAKNSDINYSVSCQVTPQIDKRLGNKSYYISHWQEGRS